MWGFMQANLHSTMFLLILAKIIDDYFDMLFTFHNVSINSSLPEETRRQVEIFTFHNVSINS